MTINMKYIMMIMRFIFIVFWSINMYISFCNSSKFCLCWFFLKIWYSWILFRFNLPLETDHIMMKSLLVSFDKVFELLKAWELGITRNNFFQKIFHSTKFENQQQITIIMIYGKNYQSWLSNINRVNADKVYLIQNKSKIKVQFQKLIIQSKY